MLAARITSGFVAFDLQRIVHQAGGDIQAALDQTDIFVARPEQGLNAAGDLNAGFHSCRFIPRMWLSCMREQQERPDCDVRRVSSRERR